MFVMHLCLCGPHAAFKRLTEKKNEGGLTGKLQIKDDEKEKWEESTATGEKVGGQGQEKIKGFKACFIDAGTG